MLPAPPTDSLHKYAAVGGLSFIMAMAVGWFWLAQHMAGSSGELQAKADVLRIGLPYIERSGEVFREIAKTLDDAKATTDAAEIADAAREATARAREVDLEIKRYLSEIADASARAAAFKRWDVLDRYDLKVAVGAVLFLASYVSAWGFRRWYRLEATPQASPAQQ